jgi:hypothetical protein
MTAVKTESDGERSNGRVLALSFGLIVSATIACDLYASFDARGVYADAGALVVIIYEMKGFFVSGTRAAVEIMRQAPIVLVARYTSATLFECAQAITFVMLALPTIFCAACWWIAPKDRKAWTLFPLAFLLIGFAPTSMHAVGEAAIATSYYWILLFVLLFKTRSTRQQALFLLLCVPAFWLHEGTFPLTVVLLFAIAMRVDAGVGSPYARLFHGSASFLLAAILANQIYWVIYPLYPDDRAHIMDGLINFEFLYVDHHFNLPLVTGVVALFTLSGLFVVHALEPIERATRHARWIVVSWTLFALAAMAAAITAEESFSPFSQLQVRYHPPMVSAALGAVMILLLRYQLPERLWMTGNHSRADFAVRGAGRRRRCRDPPLECLCYGPAISTDKWARAHPVGSNAAYWRRTQRH